MGTDGDILDEFDDERLEQAIERADGEGPWRDQQSQFVDPKVQELLRELQAPPPRLQRSKKRPKRDVPPPAGWQQPGPGAGGPGAGRAPAATSRSPFGPADPDLAAFERHLDTDPAVAAPPAGGPLPEPATPPLPAPRVAAAAPATPSAAREVALAMLAAASVFAAVVASHGAIAGWTADLFVRGLAASVLTGFTWHITDSGRFRSPLIAVGAELLLFASTGRIGETDVRVAVGVGAMVAMLVGGVLGISREHRYGGGVRR